MLQLSAALSVAVSASRCSRSATAATPFFSLTPPPAALENVPNCATPRKSLRLTIYYYILLQRFCQVLFSLCNHKFIIYKHLQIPKKLFIDTASAVRYNKISATQISQPTYKEDKNGYFYKTSAMLILLLLYWRFPALLRITPRFLATLASRVRGIIDLFYFIKSLSQEKKIRSY
jgi:hypothetical protein